MFDVAGDLKGRFGSAALFYMSAWEYEPDGMIDDHTVRDLTDEEVRCISLFKRLAETIPAIPASILKTTEELYAAVGADKYEEFAFAAIRAVGYRTFPTNATEFLTTLNLSLQFLART
ncbi:hypothetical protein V1282_003523 [Nitrobacteraceae bacterium AZCC 2146]